MYDEVNDSYQEFYIYNGTVELWAGENDCGKWVETNVTYESGVIILDIDSWENADYLAVRFNAHGDLWDKWIVRSVNIVVQVTN